MPILYGLLMFYILINFILCFYFQLDVLNEYYTLTRLDILLMVIFLPATIVAGLGYLLSCLLSLFENSKAYKWLNKEIK